MRKQIFVCGIALCLALSMVGCGKSPEERQAANYYQNELGLDKEEAESLAHEIYGEVEEEPGATEDVPEEIVVEPLPQLVNSEWYEQKLQIYDMVFTNDWHMTEEDIRKIVEGSAYDVELIEDFDKNGKVCINGLKVNGVSFSGISPFFETTLEPKDTVYPALRNYGWYNDDYCYHIPTTWEGACYDKSSIEFEGLKTRDDVLAYLAENGFVEVEEEQACYGNYRDYYNYNYGPILYPDRRSVEYADTPHYYCKGAQSIELYRMHKLSETDQEISIALIPYSGARLYLFNRVFFSFDTDGTINDYFAEVGQAMIVGEKIN